MRLESQSAINPHHKSRPIKADQPSIAWIKFITPSSSFGPSLERPVLESAQISWIGLLSASLIFLDLALVIGPTGTCNGSLNALWFSSMSDLGFRWWKKAWVACRSYRDSTRRSGAWPTSTSRASATTTTAKVTQWNPTGSAWPTTCSNSISPPLAGPSTLSSSSTMATLISLSTGPMDSTMRRSLRLLGFATSMISCLAFLTKQSNKIQFQHFHKLIIDQCCKFIFK